jgi:cytochrome oxidase Cu insertion factor (SCO1/SenC/PrrC family)
MFRLAACVGAVVAVMLVMLPAMQAAPRPAPAFSLELFNGQTLTLADLKGKAVLLLFWAPW